MLSVLLFQLFYLLSQTCLYLCVFCEWEISFNNNFLIFCFILNLIRFLLQLINSIALIDSFRDNDIFPIIFYNFGSIYPIILKIKNHFFLNMLNLFLNLQILHFYLFLIFIYNLYNSIFALLLNLHYLYLSIFQMSVFHLFFNLIYDALQLFLLILFDHFDFILL